jgi:hypothetical protein
VGFSRSKGVSACVGASVKINGAVVGEGVIGRAATSRGARVGRFTADSGVTDGGGTMVGKTKVCWQPVPYTSIIKKNIAMQKDLIVVIMILPAGGAR